MEPTEIDEFRKQVKEGGESGLSYVSLAISILAVLVAMVTVLGHRTHTEAVLQQAKASDQWNEYQAKKTRQHEEILESNRLSHQSASPSADEQNDLAKYKVNIKKWEEELPEEQQKAEEFEADVKKAERQAGHYDLGEALLEIAVVLSSITLLTRQKIFFFGGLALGIAGTVIAAYALILH
jgi:uncharacterized protein HemX